MRHFFRILLLLFVSLSFMSCVDYVQTIGYKNGKYQLYYKITLSKMIFALAEEDPEETLQEISGESFPEGVSIRKVDTDLEAGAEFSFELDPRKAGGKEKDFLPVSSGNSLFIPFLLGKEESISEAFGSTNGENAPDSEGSKLGTEMGDALANAMLSSAKCRMLLSKKMIPAIGTVYFEGLRGQDCSLPVFDYGESYCIEIPLILLTEKNKYKFDRVVVSLP